MKYFRMVNFMLIIVGIVSCSDMLDENPKSLIKSDSFYQTEEDARTAVNAIYSGFTDDHARNMYHLNALTTDEGIPGPGEGNSYAYTLNNYTFRPVNGIITETWTDHYKTINVANTALAKIPNVDIQDKNLKNEFLGESSFMRALCYFRLVRFFGDVPLLTSPTESAQDASIERTPSNAVYEQIVKDFTFAENNLFTQNNTALGRPSVAAAKGLLAKVYLTRENWEMAAQKAKEIMDRGTNGLMTNFSDVFRPQIQPNKENIFVYNFVAGNSATDQQFELKYYIPRNIIPGVRGLDAYLPSQSIYDSFDEEDLRRDWTLFTSYTTAGKTYTFPPHWHKHWDSTTLNDTGDNNSNVPIIRYADILLIYAEAINELNGPTQEAYEAINKVRRRAYGKDINIPSSADLPQDLTQDDFRAAVWEERKWEFAGERNRWFDLKRTGRLLPVMSKWLSSNTAGHTIQKYQTILPIPQDEIDNNDKISQNPGY